MFHSQTTIHYKRLFLYFVSVNLMKRLMPLRSGSSHMSSPSHFMVWSYTVKQSNTLAIQPVHTFALFSFSIIVMYNVILGPLHSSDLSVWAPGGESQCEVSTQGNLYTVSSLHPLLTFLMFSCSRSRARPVLWPARGCIWPLWVPSASGCWWWLSSASVWASQCSGDSGGRQSQWRGRRGWSYRWSSDSEI